MHRPKTDPSVFEKGPTRLFPKKPLSQEQRFSPANTNTFAGRLQKMASIFGQLLIFKFKGYF